MKSKLLLFAVLPAFFFFACNDDSAKEEDTETNTEVTTEVADNSVKETEAFKSEEFGFSVEFPGTPTQDSQDVPTDIGNLKMNTFMYDATDHVYFIAISDMPKLLSGLSNSDDILDSGVEGMLGEFSNVNIIKKEKIELDGHPGRLIEATGMASEMSVYNKAQIYLVDNVFFQVYVIAEKDIANKDKISDFINSFKLIEKKKEE